MSVDAHATLYYGFTVPDEIELDCEFCDKISYKVEETGVDSIGHGHYENENPIVLAIDDSIISVGYWEPKTIDDDHPIRMNRRWTSTDGMQHDLFNTQLQKFCDEYGVDVSIQELYNLGKVGWHLAAYMG